MERNKFLLFFYFFNKLVTNKLKIYIDHDIVDSCRSDGGSHSSGSGDGGGSGGIGGGDSNDSRMVSGGGG